MTGKREETIKYLRHIGNDFAEEDENIGTSPECRNEVFCPKHNNCGVCRFEYMEKKGWLNA